MCSSINSEVIVPVVTSLIRNYVTTTYNVTIHVTFLPKLFSIVDIYYVEILNWMYVRKNKYYQRKYTFNNPRHSKQICNLFIKSIKVITNNNIIDQVNKSLEFLVTKVSQLRSKGAWVVVSLVSEQILL